MILTFYPLFFISFRQIRNVLKGVETTLKILSKNRPEIKIDELQARNDLIVVYNKTGSKDFYHDKGMDKILNLPTHRAANVLRLMVKTGCELSK